MLDALLDVVRQCVDEEGGWVNRHTAVGTEGGEVDVQHHDRWRVWITVNETRGEVQQLCAYICDSSDNMGLRVVLARQSQELPVSDSGYHRDMCYQTAERQSDEDVRCGLFMETARR